MTDIPREEGAPAPPPPFALDRLEGPDDVVVLALSGELDMAIAPTFRESVQEALAGARRALVLDISEVVFMDSSMLKELLRLHAELEGRIAVAAPRPPVRRLLELTRTTSLFTVTDDRDAALAAVRG